MNSLIIALVTAIVALLFAAFTARRVIAEDEGDETMRSIAKAIQEGASAFLRREYTFLGAFVIVVTIVLAIFIDYDVLDRFPPLSGELTDLPRTAISYVLGAVFSATAGYVGMYVAVRANVRTANKAREGLNPALRIAFSSGSSATKNRYRVVATKRAAAGCSTMVSTIWSPVKSPCFPRKSFSRWSWSSSR